MFYNFIFFFLQSLQWILFNCGVMIEPCLKFYAVPSQSQCMTLRSRSGEFEFFCVKSLQCQLLQSLWLIWILFGMNAYKILKCFRKEKRVSGELPCPATGLIDKLCVVFPRNMTFRPLLRRWKNYILYDNTKPDIVISVIFTQNEDLVVTYWNTEQN